MTREEEIKINIQKRLQKFLFTKEEQRTLDILTASMFVYTGLIDRITEEIYRIYNAHERELKQDMKYTFNRYIKNIEGACKIYENDIIGYFEKWGERNNHLDNGEILYDKIKRHGDTCLQLSLLFLDRCIDSTTGGEKVINYIRRYYKSEDINDDLLKRLVVRKFTNGVEVKD